MAMMQMGKWKTRLPGYQATRRKSPPAIPSRGGTCVSVASSRVGTDYRYRCHAATTTTNTTTTTTTARQSNTIQRLKMHSNPLQSAGRETSCPNAMHYSSCI